MTPTTELIHESRFCGRQLSSFDRNLGRPRHRWYEFKEGFSDELVQEAISSVITERRNRQLPLRVLDPFSGSGTTLVTALRHGHVATGIEVNPFLAFAATAKCVPGTWKTSDFESDIEQLMSASAVEVPSHLEGLSTFCQGGTTEKWLFNRSVLRGFAALDREIRRKRRFARPLRLSLFASLMDCCNARRDGKCLRYRKDWKSLGFSSTELRLQFRQRVKQVIDDINPNPFPKNAANVICDDSREALRKLAPQSFDLVVTSPPYLNSFDYSDVYRPELFAGGFVANNSELMRIRLTTLRSHVQAKWESAQGIASSLLNPVLDHLRSNKNSLWCGRIPEMVQAYFEDMKKIFESVYRVCKPGAQVWLVVSTSAYAGIEIPVDLILADCATKSGFHMGGIFVLRELRASGQQWSDLRNSAPMPLRESLLIFKR